MSKDLSSIYGAEFYDRFDEESTRSAQAIVPLVMELMEPKSVVDVGCGLGQWLGTFESCGVSDILGIDGSHIRTEKLRIPTEKFRVCDLAGSLPLMDRRFDLAVSLEVAEHLPQRKSEEFVGFLTRLSGAVMFSAALPGQGGYGHINEQWPWYWHELFSKFGYVMLDPFRPDLWSVSEVAIYYKHNLYLYVDPSIHQDLIRQVGVSHPNLELTLIRTAMLKNLTGPSALAKLSQRIRYKILSQFGIR